MKQTTQADIDALRTALLADIPDSKKAVASAALNVVVDALIDLATIANSFERVAVALEKRS